MKILNIYSNLLLLIPLLLLSCTKNNNSPSQPSEQKGTDPKSVSKTTPLLEKAEKVCGDRPPTDPKSYPVSFYPVSVEYSDRNLELVRKHFCEDASKLPSKSLGKDVLQVASFISREKAESFREKLSQHFSQSRVGEPTIVENPKSDVGDRKAEDQGMDTVKSIHTDFPALNEAQLQQLRTLNGRVITTPQKESSVKLKVALPTVLPAQTKIIRFNVNDTGKLEYNIRDNPLSYTVFYKTNQNSCFIISLDNGQWGDGPTGWKSVQVNTPFFGIVPIEKAEFDKANPVLSRFMHDVKDKTGESKMYRYSMSVVSDVSGLSETKGCKADLPFDSAVKIIKSIRSLD